MIKTKTITEYECDRCGHKTRNPRERPYGDANVTLQRTVYAYDGAAGGYTRELWLCGRCASSLDAFLDGSPVVTRCEPVSVAFPNARADLHHAAVKPPDA